MASLHFNNSNYRQHLAVGTAKFVRIIEVFELQRFELRKVNYKRFLRNFHGDFKFVRIMEIFELRGFELGSVNLCGKTGTRLFKFYSFLCYI